MNLQEKLIVAQDNFEVLLVCTQNIELIEAYTLLKKYNYDTGKILIDKLDNIEEKVLNNIRENKSALNIAGVIASLVKIKIHPPVEIKESEVYGLVIQDQTGKYHYFNEDGTYDGFSMDWQINI